MSKDIHFEMWKVFDIWCGKVFAIWIGQIISELLNGQCIFNKKIPHCIPKYIEQNQEFQLLTFLGRLDCGREPPWASWELSAWLLWWSMHYIPIDIKLTQFILSRCPDTINSKWKYYNVCAGQHYLGDENTKISCVWSIVKTTIFPIQFL